MTKRKGYKAPKTRDIDGKTYRLEQSTKTKAAAQKIKKKLVGKKWNVRVLEAPKSSRYNWEVYKRKEE